jgi:hypothetical protein
MMELIICRWVGNSLKEHSENKASRLLCVDYGGIDSVIQMLGNWVQTTYHSRSEFNGMLTLL